MTIWLKGLQDEYANQNLEDTEGFQVHFKILFRNRTSYYFLPGFLLKRQVFCQQAKQDDVLYFYASGIPCRGERVNGFNLESGFLHA